jgi:AraC-like DNA-binding protein
MSADPVPRLADHVLQQALERIRDRLADLAERVSPPVEALLLAVGRHFNDSDYSATRIRREAGATEYETKLFKKELGLALGAFVLECRLELALWLFRNTPLRVEDVARVVGYRSTRGLEMLFEGLCGIPPGQASDDLGAWNVIATRGLGLPRG